MWWEIDGTWINSEGHTFNHAVVAADSAGARRKAYLWAQEEHGDLPEGTPEEERVEEGRQIIHIGYVGELS